MKTVIEVRKGKTAVKREVEFRLPAEAGRTVCIAGSFNDWEPTATPMPYDAADACYKLRLELAPGYYEYKFVIDGQWLMDETNHNFAANDFGTLNSVLTVE